MNGTNIASSEPVWQTYASIITFGMGVVMYSCFTVAVLVIIIGRNIIPSLLLGCCRRKNNERSKSVEVDSILKRREIPLVSIFFIFFLFYNMYSVVTCVAMALGYVGRVLDHDQYTSNVIITVFHVLYYGNFFFFFVYSCFYVVLLMNVTSVWFHIIDFGGTKKKKIFQGIVTALVIGMMVVALFVIVVIDSCIYFRMTNKPIWTTVLLVTATVNVCCHATLTFLAIAMILFSIIMIAKYGSNASNNERMSKLKVYSVKLIVAIAMLFLANTFRLTSLVILGLQNMGAPSFISSPLLGLLIPDFLDMSVCVIIYWPFKLLWFNTGNATWQKIVNPINFNALYKENDTPPKQSTQTIQEVHKNVEVTELQGQIVDVGVEDAGAFKDVSKQQSSETVEPIADPETP